MLYNPAQLTYANGSLYVADVSNQRISSYSASTGAFTGWIGRISTNPTSGCSYGNNGAGYSVSQSGWCFGGTATSAGTGTDKGGGFSNANGITNDGTYLYVANYYNNRIDRIRMADGVTTGVVRLRADIYTDVWQTTNATMNTGWYNVTPPINLWTDGTYIYATAYNMTGTSGSGVVKVNLTTGTVVGWQGAITTAPTAGDTNCAGASLVTPGWCQGGATAIGYTMGGFNSPVGISGDANFIYITDDQNHRMTRVPK